MAQVSSTGLYRFRANNNFLLHVGGGTSITGAIQIRTEDGPFEDITDADAAVTGDYDKIMLVLTPCEYGLNVTAITGTWNIDFRGDGQFLGKEVV